MEEKAPKNNRMKLLIGAVVVLAVLAYAVSAYLNGRSYETTDNAQLDGDLLPVRAGISGYVSSIRFQDNQEIRRGDTLIVFDTAERKAEVERISAELENAKLNVGVSRGMAEASLQSANAAVFESESGQQVIQSARSSYDQALADLSRAKQLLEIRAMTQNAYEQLQTSADIAKATYLKAKAQMRSSTSNSSGLKTRALTEGKQVVLAGNVILQKQAELDAAKAQLKHAFIIAPFDGIVTRRIVQTGQYVSAGQALCAVINHHELWVTANFKETQMNKIKPGQKVDIAIDAFQDIRLTGTIDSYGGATGARFALVPPDNSTGNFIKIAQRFPVRIKLDNRSGKDQLYPGLSAFVKVKLN
ncbi:HlyD family secretion protein [Pedobacter sp. KBW06]|uniref:HlyD family secretion protein n=1 Tax=Pedobacter sp. KBW06 TaxID=2153359 RepID=UPI000F5A563C|nr:HlyD family secretion protein [Pedobacter sp. KBW06]RQO69456.1 HlyD family secretion protein [Pedobacter sp. KBW06]